MTEALRRLRRDGSRPVCVDGLWRPPVASDAMLAHLRRLLLVCFIALLGCDGDVTELPILDAGPRDSSVDMDALVTDAGSDAGSVDMDSCVVTAEVRDMDGALQARTRWTYDGSYNTTTVEYDDDADGAAEHTDGYTYDDDGKVSTAMYDRDDESLLYSHVYDVDDNLMRVDVSGSRLLGFDYSYEAGLLVRVLGDPISAVPGAMVLSYDASERLSTCTRATSAASGYTSEYSYSPEGNRLTRDFFYLNSEGTNPERRSTMTYDSEGNPLTEDVNSIRYVGVNTLELGELRIRRTWTYDTAGNVLTRETDLDGDGSVDQHTTWIYECGPLPASPLPAPDRIVRLDGDFNLGYLASLCPR